MRLILRSLLPKNSIERHKVEVGVCVLKDLLKTTKKFVEQRSEIESRHY